MRKKENDTAAVDMISYCSTQIANTTDYAISHAVVDAVENTETISLESIAESAAVSQTSVSRFIRKAGFPSFQKFRERYKDSMDSMHLGRKLFSYRQFGNMSDEELVRQLHDNAVRNMNETLEHLDLAAIRQVAEQFHHAHSVTFFGDDHALSDIYPVQLDLCAAGIPAYRYKMKEIQKHHAATIENGDMVVFLNVYYKWMTKEERKLLKDIKKRTGALLVGFFQDTDEEIEGLFDLIVRFGEPGSKNEGFFSLLYIQRILAEMFYASDETN